MSSHHVIDNSPLNRPQHMDNKFYMPPLSLLLIALGTILMIGGAVAAGVLFVHLGPSSQGCLVAIPAGISLIIIGLAKASNTQAQSEGLNTR
jgi:hypothetical protein